MDNKKKYAVLSYQSGTVSNNNIVQENNEKLELPKDDRRICVKEHENKKAGLQSTILQNDGVLTKFKSAKELYKDLSSGFFDPDDELNKQENTKNYFATIKAILGKIFIVLALLLILNSYLNLLGTELSQNLKYVSSLVFSYDVTDIPRLLPIHQFFSFETQDIADRIKCKQYGDPEQCYKIEITRCELKGILTEKYEECIVQLSNRMKQNATQFCESHYNRDIWKDDMSPRYLQYYLRKHNCYSLSGKNRGREYCVDYFEHEDSWGQTDLFQCYARYNVDYGKEFCDSKFKTGVDLMRCYKGRDVPRGEQFCLSYFNTTKELITCYEDIPIYTKNYCDLKYVEKTPKLDCYRNKANLVLDEAYCNRQYSSVNERYNCYKDIGLLEFKDRSYCELNHLNNMTAKYECIGGLNKEIAYEKASMVCEKEDDGFSLRKETAICRIEIARIIEEQDGEVVMKGADYCKFKYPWDDLVKERYECLEFEGVPKQYLSSQCKKNNKTCYEEFGIPYYPNECSKYLVMPRNQNFVMDKVKPEEIMSFVSSNNLKLNKKNFEYTSLDYDEDLISTKDLPFLGSQNSFEDFQVWVLDTDYEEFLNNAFDIPEYLESSYGHFLIRQDGYKNNKDLLEEQTRISRLRAKFYNPLFEDEDITEQKVFEVPDVDTEAARKTSEEIASVFGKLQQTTYIGTLMKQIDDLFGKLEMHDENTLLQDFQNELRETNNNMAEVMTMPVGKLIYQDYQDFISKQQMDWNVSVEVAVSLVFDLALASPTLDIMFSAYENPELQPYTGQFVNSIYHKIQGQSLNQLILELSMPENPFVIFDELGLTKLYEEALYLKLLKYQREHLTTISFQELIEALENTKAAGSLIREEKQTYDTIIDELDYVQSRDVTFYTKIDTFVQQKFMSQIINDIMEAFGSPSLNLTHKHVTQKDTAEILSIYGKSPFFKSLAKNEQSAFVLQSLDLSEDMPLVEIFESIQDRKNIGFLYKEYRDLLLPSDEAKNDEKDANVVIDTNKQDDPKDANETPPINNSSPPASIGRLLQSSPWQVGIWTLEDRNQLLASLGPKEFRFNMISKSRVQVNGNTLKLNDQWNSYNSKGELSIKRALGQEVLNCHFSGDYSEPPWWELKFDGQKSVKSITLFNFQNGAKTSNLEGASIYVGDTLCARIGSKLPLNYFITIDCEDTKAPAKNVFSQQETKPFGGTQGSSLRIESANPGVLVVCNFEISIQVVDLEIEKQIDQVVSQCKIWQSECLSKFPGILNSENKFNCLQLYGVNKTPQFCLDQLSVNQENFFYPLKHKYECMFGVELSDQVGNCLNLYYNYKVEECLKKYESQYLEIGFSGEKPSEDDHLGYLNEYWKTYTNLTESIFENTQPKQEKIIEEIEEEIIEEVIIGEINVPEFLCSNVAVIFKTNPFDKEQTFSLQCSSFQIESKTYLQFKFAEQLEGSDLGFVINRTDSNYQTFYIKFGQKLEFIQLKESFMFKREQNPLDHEIDSPQISDPQSFNDFVSNPYSLKLYESYESIIGNTGIQTTNLVSVPFRNNSLGVATHYRLWKYPIFFQDIDNEKIVITPELNTRLTQPSDSFETLVHLKFDFFKMEFEYTFFTLSNLLSELGGASSLAQEFLMSLGALFLILWMLQFARGLVQKHQEEYIAFVKTNLQKYREVAEEQDKEKIDQIMMQQEEQMEGGENNIDEEEELKRIDQKYGQMVKTELLSEFKFQRGVHNQLSKSSIFDTAAKAKKDISFLGIIFTDSKMEETEQKIIFLQKKNLTLFPNLVSRQNIIAEMMKDDTQAILDQQIEIEIIRKLRNAEDEKKELKEMLQQNTQIQDIDIPLQTNHEDPIPIDIEMVKFTPFFNGSALEIFSDDHCNQIKRDYFQLTKPLSFFVQKQPDFEYILDTIIPDEEPLIPKGRSKAHLIQQQRGVSYKREKYIKSYKTSIKRSSGDTSYIDLYPQNCYQIQPQELIGQSMMDIINVYNAEQEYIQNKLRSKKYNSRFNVSRNMVSAFSPGNSSSKSHHSTSPKRNPKLGSELRQRSKSISFLSRNNKGSRSYSNSNSYSMATPHVRSMGMIHSNQLSLATYHNQLHLPNLPRQTSNIQSMATPANHRNGFTQRNFQYQGK